MNPHEQFKAEVKENIANLGRDNGLKALSTKWYRDAAAHNWPYNFSWFGRPAIQVPNDEWMIQEIVWETRPDLIIETGVAHGGSLIFSASMLAMLDYCDAVTAGKPLDPRVSKRKVLALDIDIRSHNRAAIETHPLAHKIEMIEGSSISGEVINQVRERAKGYERILVCLDSNHTREHVLAELEAYAPLVNKGSYCVVFDTIVEDMPADMYPDRPWGPGNNPKTAVWEYLKSHPEFEIDKSIDHKLQISVAPDGFLKRID